MNLSNKKINLTIKKKIIIKKNNIIKIIIKKIKKIKIIKKTNKIEIPEKNNIRSPHKIEFNAKPLVLCPYCYKYVNSTVKCEMFNTDICEDCYETMDYPGDEDDWSLPDYWD